MTKAARTASTKAPPLLQPLSVKILFEDQHLIVLSKPAGLLSQGDHSGEPSLVSWLQEYLGRPYVGLIHRLDRNTSGLMVVAKRTKSARRLTDALQEGKIQRWYLAWLVGKLPAEMTWTHQLEKDSKTNTVKVVRKGGKPATLTVTPVEYRHVGTDTLTLAKFKLETGRSHQIRVQSAYEGFPLLGDRKYHHQYQDKHKARPSINSQPTQQPQHQTSTRVALHSFLLELPHPMSGEMMKFEDPLPKDLSDLG